MKHLLLLIIALPFFAYPQEDLIPKENNFMYAQLLGTEKFLSSKITVEIDFGQETKLFHADKNRIIEEATGKPRKFNSMVDAMNYMGTMGWEFVQAYVVTVSNQNVYHWLLRKELTQEDISEFLPMIRNDLTKE